MKRQNDNTSLGLGTGRLVPSSHKGSEFRYAVLRQFSTGDERIGELIPVPDSLWKEVFFYYTRLYLHNECDWPLSVENVIGH